MPKAWRYTGNATGNGPRTASAMPTRRIPTTFASRVFWERCQKYLSAPRRAELGRGLDPGGLLIRRRAPTRIALDETGGTHPADP